MNTVHWPIESKDAILVVDLDGTLVRTDVLFEMANQFIARNPFRIANLLAWLLGGRATLKSRLAQATDLDVSRLPYNIELITWLREEHSRGRVLALATASPRSIAERIAAHLKIFSFVFATDDRTNLKADSKRDVLVSKFGERGFDYVGNERADIPIWRSSRRSIVVERSGCQLSRIISEEIGNLGAVFRGPSKATLASLWRSLRPHQWTKNVLLLVPLITAHKYAFADSLVQAILAFIAFGVTASAVYVLNDLTDVSDDRLHERKRSRPFASGDLSLVAGWFVWPALLAVAVAMAALLFPIGFLGTLVLYVALTTAYSLRLKQSAIVDILTLAGLYTLRVIAGAAAISVPVSFWLLSFSMFFFLSLACIKRFSELKLALGSGAVERVPGRGYYPTDLPIMAVFGVGAGYIAVLVLALYIQDSHAGEMYRYPEAFWLLCPLILYWISRTWLFAYRGWMHEDPVVFAIKDRISWYVGVLVLLTFVVARIV
jgi:4-hydroxybenzoate polyprenyltransferase/phosphoserine phosphatase